MNIIKLNVIGEGKVSAKGGSGGGGGSAPIEKPIGVFIYTTDGEFITSDAWDTANNDKAVGVFVNDGEHDFVIAKRDAYGSGLRWGGYKKQLTSVPAVSSKDSALFDFNGADNTPKIIAELEGYNDTYVTGAPAAEVCANFIFPNGKNGYLPALGEWNLAYTNKTAIVDAMKKCGGVAITLSYYWSSTQYSANSSWRLAWSNGGINGNFKNELNYFARAFCKI